jgi:hypothetical protein
MVTSGVVACRRDCGRALHLHQRKLSWSGRGRGRGRAVVISSLLHHRNRRRITHTLTCSPTRCPCRPPTRRAWTPSYLHHRLVADCPCVCLLLTPFLCVMRLFVMHFFVLHFFVKSC